MGERHAGGGVYPQAECASSSNSIRVALDCGGWAAPLGAGADGKGNWMRATGCDAMAKASHCGLNHSLLSRVPMAWLASWSVQLLTARGTQIVAVTESFARSLAVRWYGSCKHAALTSQSPAMWLMTRLLSPKMCSAARLK